MAGLVDNIFGITQRQYEEEKRQGLQDLATRLSSGGNISADRAMLGATIGDYLGTKLGVAMGGTDPRQEVRDNKAKMEALNSSLENLAPDDSRRFYMLADAYQSAGDSATASKYILQGQQMDALKEAKGEANRVREERTANEFADRMDIQDKHSSAAAYSQDPSEENKARALEMGNTPSQLANLREASSAPMTEGEVSKLVLKSAQLIKGQQPWLTEEEAVTQARALIDSVFNPKPKQDDTAVGGEGGVDTTVVLTPDQLELQEALDSKNSSTTTTTDPSEPSGFDKAMSYLGDSYKYAKGSGLKSTIDTLQGIGQKGITFTDHRDMYRTEPLPSSGMFMLQNPDQQR